MKRLYLPGLGCPARIYDGPVMTYDPALSLEGNAAAIGRSLTEPTLLVGHSMGGIVASLVGGQHPVVNIEGLPDRPSEAAVQLAAGQEPTAASLLWRSLLSECDPEAVAGMARQYELWLALHSAVATWSRVTARKLYVFGLGPGGNPPMSAMGYGLTAGIPHAGHFPMIDRPLVLNAIIGAFERADPKGL